MTDERTSVVIEREADGFQIRVELSVPSYVHYSVYQVPDGPRACREALADALKAVGAMAP